MVHQHRSLMASFAILAVMGIGCCGCGGCGGDPKTVEERQKESDELWKTDQAKAVAVYKETYKGFWTSRAEKTRILPRIVEFEARAGNTDEASEWVNRGIKNKLDVEYKDPASLKVVAAVEKANEEARLEAEKVEEEEAKVRAKEAAERKERARKDDEGSFRRKSEAWELAKELVTRLLKSPSTASFGGLFSEQNPKANVRWGGGGKYQAHGWVDSQNAFGATVRCEFIVELEYDYDKDKWKFVGDPQIVQRR